MLRAWDTLSQVRFLGQRLDWWLIFLAELALLAFVIFCPRFALAEVREFDPATADFFGKLKQPDNTSSCCGDGDAYFADDVETNAAGDLVAIVTDTRADEWTNADGTTGRRAHIVPGTKFVVPKNKIRPFPTVPNPTGHNVIFIGSPSEYDFGPAAPSWQVYCWEPVAKI